MFNIFNKIISIILTIIFITGIFPPVVFAQPTSTSLGEVKGFNRAVIDSHFSRADRELNPEHWLTEAKFGITQAICAWELIAGSLYDNPLLYEEAKAQIIKWSDEELEKRFSQWLMGRFFGKAAEDALLNLSSKLNESQKYYSWHLDEDGNVIFDDKTGDPLVIRPNEEGREFSHDLTLWRNETDEIVKIASASFNNVINSFYPELLAYIPAESRESISAVIKETFNTQSNVIKREFENIAAREERNFINRRTRDIWSLRKKSDNETAVKFTEKLIAETDESCKRGIEELNAKIEQASAGAGDLALLGEEWLRLYKEQFERGLKAWEDAEERFFIRRIEWEQESFKLFSDGEAVWLSAFNQFEEEKQKWELNVRELFQTGESLFKNISKDFEKTIADAKKEFELNAAIRIGEGTNKVKALIDIYLICTSTAISSMDNIKFWQNQYGNTEKEIKDQDFSDWILKETKNLWKQTESDYLNDSEYISDCEKLDSLKKIKDFQDSHTFPISTDNNKFYTLFFGTDNYDDFLTEFNNKYSKLFEVQTFLKGEMTLPEQIAFAKNMNSKHFSKSKFEALIEMQTSYTAYLSYTEKSLDARDKIYKYYAEIFETGLLKDILSSEASRSEFFLDEYQVALVRAKALVLYWERKNSIADSVMAYAGEFSAGRMTEAEGSKAWEEAKAAYNESLANYETELNKLGKIGENVQKQQEVLKNLTVKLQKEEDKLNQLFSEYSELVSISAVNLDQYYLNIFNENYNELIEKYNNFQKTGVNSVYFSALKYGMLWDIAEQRETAKKINNILENSVSLSEKEIVNLQNILITLDPDFKNEIWQDTCNSLSLLFQNYGLETQNNIFPDVKLLCQSIFAKQEDFTKNAAQFLSDFDNCFSMTPSWLQYEIESWKEAFIEYITTFAICYKFQPEYTTTELVYVNNYLMDCYSDFFEFINTYNYSEDDNAEQINNKIIEISNMFIQLEYMYRISEAWEQLNQIALTGNETHWRQYLINEYITNKDSSLLTVSSWTAGIFEDALFYAVYYTNRINDSFNIYSLRNTFSANENSEQLYNLYYDEIYNIFLKINALNNQQNEIISAIKVYNNSKLPSNDIKEKLIAAEKAKNNQENALNSLREEYNKQANIFINLNSQYDDQYKILTTAYNNTDQKRFDYEKQDAIQKWASSSYINTDNINPDNCKANLLKAQTVLNVLSDLSNNGNRITYNNPEYEALYNAYEQSFSKNVKTIEALGAFSYAYTQEKINNQIVYIEYQDSLHQLGKDFNYSDYNLPESKSEWKIENIITFKNGRLAFSRDESMNLSGVDSIEADSVNNFFNSTKLLDGERFKITAYEEALKSLSQRMSEYFTDPNKFLQWSYARNYLLLSLKNKNDDLEFLNNYLSIKGELDKEGSLESEYIKKGKDSKNETLGSIFELFFILHGNGNLNFNNLMLFSIKDSENLFDYENLFRNEWNKLSEEEKADLEFYIILTLTTEKDYFNGFSKMYTNKLYEYAQNYTYDLYTNAQDNMNKWYNGLEYNKWMEVRDVNRSTYNRIKSVYQETSKSVNNWINGLQTNLKSIQNLSSLYSASCEKLDAFEGIKTDNQKIIWKDLELALLNTKTKLEDINELKLCWDAMQKKNGNSIYKNVSEAFMGLISWTSEQVSSAKNTLETRIAADMQNRQTNEKNYLSIVDDYFNGTADIKKVKTAAENAYGKNTTFTKDYLDKMYGTLINNLSMYTDMEVNVNSFFGDKENEIISLTEKIIRNRYNAELAARESEWNLTRKDITEKYNEWQNTAAQILENGRTDWSENFKKLENAYKQWKTNFQNEYERVNYEWAYAYLAGLEDKEKWLEQAADAANQASSESFLSLVGTEGERLSRFMDTREPFGIIDAVPEAQILMTNLIQSSGIVNMTAAFNSLNNYTGLASSLVKRGIGGASAWNSSFAKAAAFNLARETNTEIANSESRRLAYSARMAADEAVKGLTTAVNTANQSVRDAMDNAFIFQGLWTKNGNNYVKNITKGSTVFEPIVSETVTIKGYKDYILEPVILRTNLDDNYLAGLNTIAIQELINNVYTEVKTIVGDIFGYDENGKIKDAEKKIIRDTKINLGKSSEKTFDEIIKNKDINEIIEEIVIERELSPGKFGSYVGYGPANKQLDEATKDRSKMFYDEGVGELGRLLSDFQYWYIIDKIGNAELASAPWDKRLWNDDGSWFKAPSIRTIGIVAGTIVAAACTGGTIGGAILSVGLSSSTEIVLGALDVAYDYKTIDEVAVNVGKSILINTLTSAAGSVFNGIKIGSTEFQGITNLAVGNINGSFGKVLTSTFMTGAQTFTTGIATSALSGITYNNKDGFGYSEEIFHAGIEGTLTSSLVSMAGAFTTTGLTAINSGIDSSKIAGFNNLNQANLQKLNQLIGSLAEQGVNYALGNDFTLNVLNLGLFTNNKYNGGLLELHLGHDGVSMNIGTGGANVSIDNLAAIYKGAQVWNVNSKIIKYGKENNFDALTALRAQYGYGDDIQKEQLWDILKGNTLINTSAEGDYVAETTINEDGKKVINLAGYKNGMSKEDQYLLAVVLGYEAYRDGYIAGEIDASGEMYTSQIQSFNIMCATIASLAMVKRINQENDWFGDLFEIFAFNDFIEKDINKHSFYSNNDSLYSNNDSLYNNNDSLYNNGDFFEEFDPKGVINFNNTDKYDYQNDYKDIPLFLSDTKANVDEINEQRAWAAFLKYKKPFIIVDHNIIYIDNKYYFFKHKVTNEEINESCKIRYQKEFEDFKNNKDLLIKNGYIEKEFISISKSGCKLMATKYILETIIGENVKTTDFHEYIIKNNFFSDTNLLTNKAPANIITAYTNGKYTVNLLTGETGIKPDEALNKITSPDEQYYMIIKIQDPIKKTVPHFVVVTSIEYTKDETGKIVSIDKFNVANSLRPSNYFNSKLSFKPSEILRCDLYSVTKNY